MPPTRRPKEATFYRCRVAGAIWAHDFADDLSISHSVVDRDVAEAIFQNKRTGTINLVQCEPIDQIVESAFQVQRRLDRPVSLLVRVQAPNRFRPIKCGKESVVVVGLPRGIRRAYDELRVAGAHLHSSSLADFEWTNDKSTLILDFVSQKSLADEPVRPLSCSILNCAKRS